MRTYLNNLITEKGIATSSEIAIDGHYGLTYDMLIDFICEAKDYHKEIRSTLVKIDFLNGDIFHYLNHLTKGMLKASGY